LLIMDSNRLKRVSGQFQKDLAEIFRGIAQSNFKGVLLTVSAVNITPDLSLARVYISVFPAKDKEVIIKWLNDNKNSIKDQLVKKLKGQLRKMPDLVFFLDDSVEREETIDKLLRGEGESPIK